jgi:hypothetical protein
MLPLSPMTCRAMGERAIVRLRSRVESWLVAMGADVNVRSWPAAAFIVLTGLTCAAPAQEALVLGTYTCGEFLSDVGDRGNIPRGAVPSLGAMIGVQLNKTWGLEVEVERGFRTTTAGSGEAVIIAFPPMPNPTREEIELYGIRARSERTQTAGMGWSAHVAWRTRASGRVDVGLLAGVSSRAYTSRLIRTTTFVSPLLQLPPNYRFPDEHSVRRMIAGGPTAGVVILVRVTDHLTVAPEFRVTAGLITDDPYRVWRSGIRSIWRF